MDRHTEISAVVLTEAKRQFYAKEIPYSEYEEILTFLFNNLTDLENNLTKKNYLLRAINIPNCKMKLLDTLNLSLSMN